MKNLIARFIREDEGQDLIEYALLMGLIALICIAAIRGGGRAVSNIWSDIQTALEGV